MIKVTGKPYRQITADWVVFENDEERTETIRVQYYPLSVKDLKDNQDKSEDEKLWLSDVLLKRLHALPDFCGEDEKPIEVNLEFLDNQSIDNLKRVFDAINEHESPKSIAVSSPEK
jgi:hypothetical protein